MSLEELAVQAANTLVGAASTDAWVVVRDRLARLFGHGRPDSAIVRRLDLTREQLVAAPALELESTRSVLEGQWLTRLSDFLTDNPQAAADLNALVEDVQGLLPDNSFSASGYSLGAGRDISVRSDSGGISIGVLHGNFGVPDPSVPDRSGG
jgi:hypothetical protein